ncbi:hypothetical protein C2G38_2237987 [Gigaspora rosea]|uniref:Uncharacterized protein n=1 Tax=Gigaspora rosea TaxID=44941 RepID=A0A397W869_9GLOM|nr:hypothetical protein C2G38_2237987 [Gigaspora rosea]CAG8586474.1 22770_t:CDS:2 [Gigaspora rosea]
MFTIALIHITREFTLKQITAIAKVEDDDPTNIVFLKTKVFIPIDETVQHYIEPFEVGDVIYLSEKFIAYETYYLVNATSIKVVDLDFDDMPAIGLNVMISARTTQTVKMVDGYSTLDFYVEERLGDREPSDFWVEVKHLTNNSYLSSKTNSINQNLRSTTAILVGTIYYHKSSSDESTPHDATEKHVMLLQDISMISTNHSTAGSRTINVPWLTQPISPARSPNKNTRSSRSTTQKNSKRGRATLSQMGATTTRIGATTTRGSQALTTALQANSMPVDSDIQPLQSQET